MLVEKSLRELLVQGAESGTLGPGSKLPTERALVEQLSAPRSAVRRALENLEHEGLITRHVGRGTFLTEAVTHKVDGAPADTSPAEIMQVRLLLEPQVATLAARMATRPTSTASPPASTPEAPAPTSKASRLGTPASTAPSPKPPTTGC